MPPDHQQCRLVHARWEIPIPGRQPNANTDGNSYSPAEGDTETAPKASAAALGPERGTLAGTRQTHHEFPPDPQLLMCGGRRVACDSHRLAADTAASTEGAKVEQ